MARVERNGGHGSAKGGELAVTWLGHATVLLELDGYARIDFRLSVDGVPYFIEANPNPEIAKSEEFAQAALHDGLDYPELLNRIINLGISRGRLSGIA